MIEQILPQRRRDLGGFEVGRVLPHPQRRMVGPFVFLDEMGPADFPPGLDRKADVRPHPHIGLSTLTYLFSGEITHRDSLGFEQAIRPGEVNWMTAGRGISHSERFDRARREGAHMHGLQAWVALPEAEEECAPAFSHHGEDALPSGIEGGLRWRLVAGQFEGVSAGVPVRSKLFYLHWELADGAVARLPDGLGERAVYVLRGALESGTTRVEAGQLAVLPGCGSAVLRALGPTLAVAIGGESLGPRFVEWNFVSSRRDRIEQARDDWRAGRFALPPNDDREWIPLPGDD
ncbi:pirin family protein [Pseudomarimonas salicorniae]|uniref:Pirin family protein n=1 Tax=Pseudomarimonas salicorniae TaxID=2933270 RepID=A0ABT0GM10_9GAMM|nr:pirin family protein [Lysobacter sp. CAU 1642]MCK7595584.1 pirin family protein [Lysobacter sp. CAU 1642]